MRVACRNTIEDFERLQSHVLRRTESGRRSTRRVFLSMTGPFALFCLIIGIFVHRALALASFVAGAVFFGWTQEAAIVSPVKREYTKEIDRPLFEPVTVTLEKGYRLHLPPVVSGTRL